MSYAYRLHTMAREELSEGYGWYEDKQRGLGDRFLKAVHNKIDEIAIKPLTYGKKGKKEFREAKVEFFPYLIVYKVYSRKKQIFINAIYNTNKNPRGKYRK
jgi:hypothetical protein